MRLPVLSPVATTAAIRARVPALAVAEADREASNDFRTTFLPLSNNLPTTLVPLGYYSGTTFEPLAYVVTVAGTAAVVAAVSFFYFQNRYIILWTKKAFARRSHQPQAGGTAGGLPPPPSWHPRSLRALKRIEASMIELTNSSARINQPTKSVLSSNQFINYIVQTKSTS